VIILIGILGFIIQIAVSIKNREKLRDTTGDLWHGRTLEWATTSPPPPYNFAFTPIVHDLDAWYDMKKRGHDIPSTGFRAIHMPRNTGAGVILSALSLVLGFAMVWYIWWLAAVSLVGLFIVGIGHTFNYARDYYIPADEVARTEQARLTAAEA
jgi:cytochrome o ubiquinol oxidase subunit 1